MRLRDEQRDCNSGEAPVLAGLVVESPVVLFSWWESSPILSSLLIPDFLCLPLYHSPICANTRLCGWTQPFGNTTMVCFTADHVCMLHRLLDWHRRESTGDGNETWWRRWASFDNWGLPNTNPRIRLMLFKPVFMTPLCWVVYHKKFPFCLKCTTIWVFPTISLVGTGEEEDGSEVLQGRPYAFLAYVNWSVVWKQPIYIIES